MLLFEVFYLFDSGEMNPFLFWKKHVEFLFYNSKKTHEILQALITYVIYQ
jgi:hypothetical protein